jgi:hypothetical protein
LAARGERLWCRGSQRGGELRRPEVGTVGDLERGQRVDPRLSRGGGPLVGSFALPSRLGGVGVELEHAEDMGEHSGHVPAGAVGKAGPIFGR